MNQAAPSEPPDPIRVLNIIARMNIGGPAHHVALLTGRMGPPKFQSVLVTGQLGPHEGSFTSLLEEYRAAAVTLPTLGRELSPGRDLQTLFALVRLIRRLRPDVVHTHTAKAGTLGRLAARLARGGSVVVVHTYHGHVLSGYFAARKTAAFRMIEWALARLSDALVGVSEATVAELVELGVAPRERFRVIRLGLDLGRFAAIDEAPSAQERARLRIAADELVALYVGRLVPIKRVDVLLDGVADARRRGLRLRLVIAGDGDQRGVLEARAAALGIASAVSFLGFRHDLERLLAAADFGILTSDSEGTPVSLIEAAAAARPAVATAVGGVPEVVTSETGVVVEAGRPDAVARGIERLAADPVRRRELGRNARDLVLARFTEASLLSTVDALYDELLRERT
jgi:glycosyltransferase involved in cell wall biosynthesis